MKTFKVNTELFLEELKMEAHVIGVQFVEKTFKTKEDVVGLKEDIVYNCLECASKELFNDENISVMRDRSMIFKGYTNKNFCMNFDLDEKVHVRLTSYKG